MALAVSRLALTFYHGVCYERLLRELQAAVNERRAQSSRQGMGQNKTPLRAFCCSLGRDTREVPFDQLRSAMA